MRILLFLRKIFFYLLLFFCLEANAHQFYISPVGNDATGNGSKSSPWKSLSAACSFVNRPGDTIFVNAGIYNETLTSKLAIGVSLIGEGDNSVITSTTLTAEWTPVIDMRSDPLANGNQSISYLKFDGNALQAAQALWIERRNNVEIHHCTFIDFRYTGIIWVGDGGNAGGDPYDKVTYPDNYVTGSKFFNNIVSNCALNVPYDWGRGALYIGGHDGMLIYNNTITQTQRAKGFNGYPIKAFANGGFMKGWKVFNNSITKVDSADGSWLFAIEGAFYEGCEFYGNTITGAIDINFMHKKSYDYGVYIHDNILGPEATSTVYYTGVILEFGVEDVIIERNNFRNCAVGIHHTMRYPEPWVKRVKVCYNKFSNLGSGTYHSAIRFGENENSFFIQEYEIYNNVFQGNPESKPYFGLHIRGFKSATDIKIINNIFLNFGWSWFESNRGNYFTNLSVENNIFYHNANKNSATLNVEPVNYIYSGNIIADPKFLSPSDFHLKRSSPAIGSGSYIPEFSYDIDSIKLSNPPNIGCYETISDNDHSGVSIKYMLPGIAIVLLVISGIFMIVRRKTGKKIINI
jgi:hypothetical protein